MAKVKFLFILLIGLGVGLLSYSCGLLTSGNQSGSATNYTIQGKISRAAGGAVNTASSASVVTHIIAIGANNEKYFADYSTPEGTFSLKVNKGWPYALGFYNQTGSHITHLGYLKQKDVDWDSLPLMSPSGEAINLGTIEVNSSAEAIPAAALTDLLTQVNMDNAIANLYGRIDDVMSLFTNVDIDSNGVFDSQENKGYNFQALIGMFLGNELASGEVTKMLNQYNETYYPVPANYQFFFDALENDGASKPASGTSGTLRFPTTIYSANGNGHLTLSCSVEPLNDDRIWRLSSRESLENSEFVTPETVPSGTYTYEVTGRGTYTLRNVNGSRMLAIGTNEGIVFPVFKITTNEAGLITTIYYKWKIREHGTLRDATAAEVRAVILDTAINTNYGNFIQSTPYLGIVLGPYPIVASSRYYAPIKIERDGAAVDVSSLNAKWADLTVLTCNYLFNSNINCSFMFSK